MLLTVGLPIYNNKDIAWLAVEGLTRQETSKEWELVVCEENNGNHCSYEFFEGYKDRLFKAGCIRIIYLPVVQGRFYLSHKWKYMASKSKGDVFLLQGSDDYPDPRRIEKSAEAFNEGYDWINTARFYCYLKDYGIYEYHHEDTNLSMGIDKGTKREYILNSDSNPLKRGVDGWLFSNVRKQLVNPKVKIVEYDEYRGVSTTGFNTISYNRDCMLVAQLYPYKKVNKELQDIIPLEVTEKLKEHESKTSKNNQGFSQ